MADDTLYLSDNSYTIKRERIQDDTGAVPDPALTATCFLSATEGGAKIGTLEVTEVPMTGGTLRAVLGGTALSAALNALLTAAETLKQPLYIFDRVVVAGLYSDNNRVRVLRHRPAGRP